MKKNHLFLGFMLMGALASCNNETNELTGYGNKEVKFNIGITSMTRTMTDGLATTFVANDQIGISAGKYDNTRYTLNGTEWSGEAIVMEGTTDFFAYYPFSENNTGKTFTYEVAADQSESYTSSDLLLAKTTAVGTEDVVTLTFDHALALVEVDATQMTGINGNITGISLQAKRAANVNLNEKTATVKDDAASEYIQLCKVDDGKYRAVVPAQSLKAGRRLFITTDATQYGCAIKDVTLQAAKLNTFTIGKDGEAANFKISGGVNDWDQNGSTVDATTAGENYVRTTLNDFETKNIKLQQNYNDIPFDTWFYRYYSDGDINDTDGFMKIEEDEDIHRKVLHIKQSAIETSNFHANQRLIGYHLNSAPISSSRFQVQVMVKGIAEGTKLRCYLRTGKFVQDDKTGEGFFGNEYEDGVSVTTPELSSEEYSRYTFDFNLGIAQKNPWGKEFVSSTEVMRQDVYICFNFIEKKAGEIKMYGLKFTPVVQE